MIAVKNILDRQIDKNKSPGLQYYFFNHDSIIYSYLGGQADIKNNIKVTENTTFNAFSVTKTFTALAVLQLAEKGILQLDDPVSVYLSDFPYPANITTRQLLAHSSGIPNPIPLSWIHLTEEHESFNNNDFFKAIFLKHGKTKNEPNEKFAYTNLGYFLLGSLIEKVSSQSYTDYVNEHIIQKIGVHSNQLDFLIHDSANHAKGYQKNWRFSNLILGFLFNKSKYTYQSEDRWTSFKNTYVNGPAYGGLIGSGSAFVRYIQELLRPNNKLISEAYKQQLFTENTVKSGKSTNMCLSWFRGELNGHTYFAHAGGGFYYCEIRLYPELNKGSVIMFNRMGMSDERFLNNIDKYFIDTELQD